MLHACGGQKIVTNSLELELCMVVSYHVMLEEQLMLLTTEQSLQFTF